MNQKSILDNLRGALGAVGAKIEEREREREREMRTEKIHMACKRLIWNAKDSYGTQMVHMKRKRFIWNARDSYGTME